MTNKVIDRIKHFSMLEVCFVFVIITLLSILIPVMSSQLDAQQLNFQLLKQRQSDLQQLIKDHPDKWWYKTDLNATNTFLKMFTKGD